MVEVFAQEGLKSLIDEGRLAASAYPGDAYEHSKRYVCCHVFKIVAVSTVDSDEQAVAFPPLLRHIYSFLSIKETGCERVGVEHLIWRALKDDLASETASSGAHVDYVVGLQHHVFVVLHHYDRVAFVSQMFQRVDEPYVVSLVKSDAWFVKNIQHVDQFRAYLCGKPDALALSAAEAYGTTGKAQVMQSDIKEKLQSSGYFFDYLMCDDAPAAVHRCFHLRDPIVEVGKLHVGHLADVLSVYAEMQGLFVESCAMAFGTHSQFVYCLVPLLSHLFLRLYVEALHLLSHLRVVDAVHVNGRHHA